MSHPVRQANEALREAAERLLAERHDLPPGSVLRCFARSVRAVLRAGGSPSEVADEAERLAREMLAQRPWPAERHPSHGARRTPLPVPRPRRAS